MINKYDRSGFGSQFLLLAFEVLELLLVIKGDLLLGLAGGVLAASLAVDFEPEYLGHVHLLHGRGLQFLESLLGYY